MNINNDTVLSEIKKKLPDFYFFLEKRFGQIEDHLSLKRFSESKKKNLKNERWTKYF
jgi:hypothetical protein